MRDPATGVNTGIDCSQYGGCDVQEEFTSGTSTLIPMRASKFYDANVRARADAQRPGVLDTSVFGHNPPDVPLSNLYYRIPAPSP